MRSEETRLGGRVDAQVVLGLDDHAPARPDQTRAGQGKVLRERQLLGRARKVGDAGDDEGPLGWEIYMSAPRPFLPTWDFFIVDEPS